MKTLRVFSVILFLNIILGGCDKTSKTYTVTFDIGEGSGIAPEKQIVSSGSAIILPGQGDMTAPPDTIFAGWHLFYNNQNDFEYHADGSSYTVTDNVTFSPYWRAYPDFYFHLNGGTLENSGIYSNDVISTPVNPVKEDYIFGGWYLDEELTEPFDKSSGLKGRISLFAKWVPDWIQRQYSFTSNTFEVPPVIDLLQFVDSDKDIHIMSDKIRIWGWSKDGKVAYSTEYASDRGGYFLSFIIMNIITDEIIFQKEFDSWKYSDNRRETPAEVYVIERELILNAMKTHAIEGYQTYFREFPFKRNNFEYTSFAETELLTETEEPERIHLKYDIIVSRNGRNKIIKNVPEVSAMLWPSAFTVFVCGYFLSPFENRALIVIAEATETKQVIVHYTYVFSGCHLNIGFE